MMVVMEVRAAHEEIFTTLLNAIYRMDEYNPFTIIYHRYAFKPTYPPYSGRKFDGLHGKWYPL
jgi:hypothetical protein